MKRAAAWAGLSLTEHQLHLLERLALLAHHRSHTIGRTGAIRGARGAFPPSCRLPSLCLRLECPLAAPPRRVLDVGAGVGLPGLPLAIVWPTTEVILLERSVRRAALARRPLLLLGLHNITVATEQLREWRAPADFIVSRAMSSPLKLRRRFSQLLPPSRAAAIGGSHRSRPNVVGYRVSAIR